MRHTLIVVIGEQITERLGSFKPWLPQLHLVEWHRRL
jgi:hypothetical protein